MNWKIKKKRYNRFKRSFSRHHEWEYFRLMSNKLMLNGFSPKRQNIRRAVEYTWRHGNIHRSSIRLLVENNKNPIPIENLMR